VRACGSLNPFSSSLKAIIFWATWEDFGVLKCLIFLIYLRKTMILYKTNCHSCTALVVKSPSSLEEKFFTRCELQGTSLSN